MLSSWMSATRRVAVCVHGSYSQGVRSSWARMSTTRGSPQYFSFFDRWLHCCMLVKDNVFLLEL
uniref:Uncharacterized protein n=1 Tax=Aegilops tauschii subsp. strangulata TaxID=200361 RepID=A0A453P8P8_AEGTS